MRKAILISALALSACGGGGTQKTTVVTADGNTMQVSSAALGSAAAQDCAAKPDFASVYPGGRITICNAGHMDATGKDAGMLIYHTDASPATVLAWVKEQDAKAGLKPGMDMPTMYSATEGTKRSTMTAVKTEGNETLVTLTWGKSPQ